MVRTLPDPEAAISDVAGNRAGRVVVNLFWPHWEGTKNTGACPAPNVSFQGHCFSVEPDVDDLIKRYSARGVVVSAVIAGTPPWANINRKPDCFPVDPAQNFYVWCAPDDSADFARFAGMVAQRYNGLNGNGRVADFIIHNEVNAQAYYDIGCGGGVPCNTTSWIAKYASDYNAAYDQIKAQQAQAKVLFSMTHTFATPDQPGTTHPDLSVKTFVTGLAGQVGAREWMIAIHPYPTNLASPQISADDYPYVTLGNIGVLAGWLRATFPTKPHAWELQLTEVGVSSMAPSSIAAQEASICTGYRNAVGTPGVTSFAYFRQFDDQILLNAGLALGLRELESAGGAYKQPSWFTWATMNRTDVPAWLNCGFEDLPYIKLRRADNPSRGHWASTRVAPAGFSPETVWKILREPAPNTRMIYECLAPPAGHTFVSSDASCYGLQPMGPLGYVYINQEPGTVPIDRCYLHAAPLYTHWISFNGCNPGTFEERLGYAPLVSP